jgi:anti-anti-sigma factor
MDKLEATKTHAGRQGAFIRDSAEGIESLHVIGDIDIANAPEFEAAIMGMTQLPGPIVIDLTKCSYIDSSALHVFWRTSRRLQFKVLAATSGTVRRIFDITNAREFLSIEYKSVPHD